MTKYTARVQYPWTVWYEQIVEVEADTEEQARAIAIAKADEAGWDGARMTDGEAGATEIWNIKEQTDLKRYHAAIDKARALIDAEC